MPGRSQQKERERKRAAASWQTLDAFLPAEKRKARPDGRTWESPSQSAPVAAHVEDANGAEGGDDCPAIVNWLRRVWRAEDHYTPTDQHGTVPPREPGNLEEPEVLSVPGSGTTGIAEGQFSLENCGHPSPRPHHHINERSLIYYGIVPAAGSYTVCICCAREVDLERAIDKYKDDLPSPDLDKAEEVESMVFWNACGPSAEYYSCSHQGLWPCSVPKCENPSANRLHIARDVLRMWAGVLAHFAGCTITWGKEPSFQPCSPPYSLWYGRGLGWSHHTLIMPNCTQGGLNLTP